MEEEEEEKRTKRGVGGGGGGGVPLAGSEASVRSRGRASHEDCCAAARDPTGIGRAGSAELPARASPSLRNLAVPRGAERGPCVKEAAPPPCVPREPDERARKDTAREGARGKEGRRETVTEREKGRPSERVGGTETRRKEEEKRESEHLLRRLRVCLVSARLCVAIRRTG